MKTCSHLANGFKHFTVDEKRHKSVASTQQTGGYFAQGYFARYFARGYFAEGDLIIERERDAAKELGAARFTAVELAQHVLDFWKHKLESAKDEGGA